MQKTLNKLPINWTYLFGVLLIVVVVAAFLQTERGVDTSGWETYENTEFGFSLKHPEDWTVAEFPEDEIAPKFNIYPEGTNPALPLTHHATGTHVSVFPEGIPTEGVFGETATSTVDFGIEVKNARMYMLEDGTPWAVIANPVRPPAGWGEAGFLWAAVRVEGLETICMRGEEIIEDMNACDVLGGDDTIVRRGSVSESEWREAVAILESFSFETADEEDITSFEDCVEAGYPVMESYPRRCRTPDGRTFTEKIGDEIGKADLVRLESPRPNEEIKSPLAVRGEARGTWFFEATFPLVLTDWDGRIIAEGFAEAQDEWMTEDFVPFRGTLEFDYTAPPFNDRGSLILQKANPSGLPENADAFEIPIRFAEKEVSRSERASGAYDGCVITGCSSHVCADEEVATTCEYLPKYACYERAICERNDAGECAWRDTTELSVCLSNPEPETGSTGIMGVVVAGPTCPVEERGGEKNCADRRYEADVIVRDAETGDEVEKFTSDPDGGFKVVLPPGNYIIDPQEEAGETYPRAGEQRITVFPGAFTSVVIKYDTGIR